MKPRVNLRLIVLGPLCAAGAISTAHQEYVYETQIRLMPRLDYNVEQEVEKFLARTTEGEGLSKAQMEENRRMLRPQFARYREGFSATGRTIIAATDQGRYVETIIPDLGTGKGRGKAKEVRYLVRHKETYSAPLGPTEAARVSASDTGNHLSRPGDLLLLARRRLAGKVIATKPVSGGIRRTFELSDPIGGRSWIELDSTADGKRLKQAATYLTSVNGDRVLMSRHTVTDYTPSGEPSGVEVERFEKDRVHQRETYRLIEVRPAKRYTYKDVLAVGNKVIDLRLGTDPSSQVIYILQDNLPSIEDLQRMRKRLPSSSGGRD